MKHGNYIVLYRKVKSNETHCIDNITSQHLLFKEINKLTTNKIEICDITVLKQINYNTFETMADLEDQTINFLVNSSIISLINNDIKLFYPLAFMDYFFCDITSSIATDGKQIMINPDFILKTTVDEIEKYIIQISMLATKLQGVNTEDYDNEYKSSPMNKQYENSTFLQVDYNNIDWKPCEEKKYTKNITETNHAFTELFKLNWFDDDDFEKIAKFINNDIVNVYSKTCLMKFYFTNSTPEYNQQVKDSFKLGEDKENSRKNTWYEFTEIMSCYFFPEN